MKQIKIFVGSSIENIEYSRAVQNNLYRDFKVVIWNQDVFKASNYYLDSLSSQLDSSDFGIFILAPNDVLVSRNKKYVVPRDNVIFELGMFIGKLGRKRAYVIIPNNTKELKLPSDLDGYTPLDYNPNDNALDSALGSACNKIRQLIKELGTKDRPENIKCKLFTEIYGEFNKFLTESKNVTLYFVHSRRWRENHSDALNKLLERTDSSLTVFLPDLDDEVLIKSLQKRFDDGEFIRGFIADAYRYFLEFKKAYNKKVKIYSYNLYPTYSFYRFDNNVLLTLYPSSSKRKPSPTFFIDNFSKINNFFDSDLKDLIVEKKEYSIEKIDELIKNGTHTRYNQ